MRLIHEIHRRSLWQVLGIYLVGSWVALQVVDVLANNFGLPDWFPAFALALLVLGLPVVLATAFVQEGVVPSEPEPGAVGAAGAEREPTARREGLLTWRNVLLGGLAAFGVWGLVATGWLILGNGGRARAGAPDLRSIAVLPFASVHTDEQSLAFTSGIHDDILTQLSRIDGLKVISRTSVMQYRDTHKTIRDIGRELQVATVLEGGVQRSGDRVRVNVQLIRTGTDEHLWAETYDKELTAANVFAIQSDLAMNIATALSATLSPQVEERLAAGPTESLEAYDLYVRGMYVLSSRGATREGVEAAIDLFDRAIAQDSGFAPAWARRGLAHSQLWTLGYTSEEQALPIVRSAVETALRLDPDLADAHSQRGSLLRVERRYEEAEAELLRALELDPGSSTAHSHYSVLLLEVGRIEDALRAARRAVELDPFSAGARRGLVSRLAFARAWDETVAEAQKLLEIDPGEADAHYYMAIAYLQQGDPRRGVAEAEKAIAINPADPYYRAGLALAHAHAGNRESALADLARAEEAGVPLKESALVLAALGDLNRAFEYLERALETEPATVGSILTDPSVDPLKADPRWEAFARRLEVR